MGNMNSPSIRPIHGKTDFPFSFVRIHRFTVSEKDVSLSLEMTRGRGSPRIVFHTAPYVCNFCQTRFPPCCEGLAPLRGTLSCAFGAALLQGPARWGLSHIGFHTVVTLSAPAGYLPLEGKAAIRDYHPLKRQHTTLVNLSAPQAPSSRAQPRDLYCTAAICTHAPSLKRHLGASFFAFPSPTVYQSAGKIPPLRSG